MPNFSSWPKDFDSATGYFAVLVAWKGDYSWWWNACYSSDQSSKWQDQRWPTRRGSSPGLWRWNFCLLKEITEYFEIWTNLWTTLHCCRYIFLTSRAKRHVNDIPTNQWDRVYPCTLFNWLLKMVLYGVKNDELWHFSMIPTHMNKRIGITHLALHKLMANTVLK